MGSGRRGGANEDQVRVKIGGGGEEEEEEKVLGVTGGWTKRLHIYLFTIYLSI